MRKCSLCNKEVKFLQGEYYTPPKEKQVFLCNECLKKAKEGKIELKEDKNSSRNTFSFVIIVLVSLFNIILFSMLFIELIQVPGSPGDTGAFLTIMLCGTLFLIWIIFAIVLAIFATKMKKENLRAIMYLDIIVLFILVIGFIIVKYL